jgi:hypothetical protein
MTKYISHSAFASGLKLSRRHAAPFKAICAAKQLLIGAIKTKRTAARVFGTTVIYVTAAITVIQAEDDQLLERVLNGGICLLKAAADVEARANLLAAYRAASLADRAAVYKIVHPEIVFDRPVGPAVDDDDVVDGEGEESVEDLIAEARISGDIASYLQKRGLTTLGDVFRES